MYDLENLENELKSKNTFSYLKIREKTIFNLNDTKIFSGECISDPRYGSNHGSYIWGNSEHVAHTLRKIGKNSEKKIPICDCSRSNQMP